MQNDDWKGLPDKNEFGKRPLEEYDGMMEGWNTQMPNNSLFAPSFSGTDWGNGPFDQDPLPEWEQMEHGPYLPEGYDAYGMLHGPDEWNVYPTAPPEIEDIPSGFSNASAPPEWMDPANYAPDFAPQDPDWVDYNLEPGENPGGFGDPNNWEIGPDGGPYDAGPIEQGGLGIALATGKCIINKKAKWPDISLVVQCKP